MRFSCEALVILKDTYDRYALIGDRAYHSKTGIRRLSPFGGVIQVATSGKTQLIQRFKARSFEEKNGLRFKIDAVYTDEFRTWFRVEAPLEPNPAERTFRKKTGPDEHNLLVPSDLQDCQFVFRAHKEIPPTMVRVGQKNDITHHLYKLYVAQLPPLVIKKLITLSTQSKNLLEFVSVNEIRKGVSYQKNPISASCKQLLV